MRCRWADVGWFITHSFGLLLCGRESLPVCQTMMANCCCEISETVPKLTWQTAGSLPAWRSWRNVLFSVQLWFVQPKKQQRFIVKSCYTQSIHKSSLFKNIIGSCNRAVFTIIKWIWVTANSGGGGDGDEHTVNSYSLQDTLSLNYDYIWAPCISLLPFILHICWFGTWFNQWRATAWGCCAALSNPDCPTTLLSANHLR